MSSKRKFAALALGRRIRPRKEDNWEPEADLSEEHGSAGEEESGDDDDSDAQSNDHGRDDEAGDSDSASGSNSEVGEPNTVSDSKVDFTSVSFGALARAQASLPPSDRRKRKAEDSTAEAEEKPTETPTRRPPRSSRPPQSVKRSSKHAPQEQTSKRAVSRRREILPDVRRQYRDPRFDPLMGPVDAAKSAKAYAFLDEYRESEMADLRLEIKKTKNALRKEELKRQLMSMESRKRARQRKEEGDKLIIEHRKKEKELVAQGKTPFYLKKREQQEQLLTNRYAGMSKGQVDRAIERKRKKVSSKEKKELISLERAPRRQ